MYLQCTMFAEGIDGDGISVLPDLSVKVVDLNVCNEYFRYHYNKGYHSIDALVAAKTGIKKNVIVLFAACKGSDFLTILKNLPFDLETFYHLLI